MYPDTQVFGEAGWLTRLLQLQPYNIYTRAKIVSNLKKSRTKPFQEIISCATDTIYNLLIYTENKHMPFNETCLNLTSILLQMKLSSMQTAMLHTDVQAHNSLF